MLPTRVNVRKLKLDPMCRKSIMLRLLPSLVIPSTASELPSREKDRSEIADPSVT
jgi:hypothetical protein